MNTQKINIQIQMLRAYAVLLVLFFHAGVPGFDKGYLGVDIFFVISGYLITSYLIKSFENETFSLYEFFEKRLRRIMPALLFVSIITTPIAFWLLLPDHLENYGQSLVASTFFANNILLYLTADYWDTRSELKPLLHTWSLGVEVQFYILYPIILYFFHSKSNFKRLEIFILLFAVSLIPLIFINYFSSQAIFYLLPFRFYEFLLGGLIAARIDKRSGKNIAFFGYILIGFGVFISDFLHGYSELLGLITVLAGCSFVIYTAPEIITKSSWPKNILIEIGGASYSLYLLHQPIFALIRASSQAPISYLVLLSVIPFVISLSFLTFKYVETPFRSKIRIPSLSFYAATIIVSILLICCGFFLHAAKGAPDRFKQSSNLDSFRDSIAYNERVRSYNNYSIKDMAFDRILIVGDSFARDFANILTDGGGLEKSSIIYSDLNLDKCENIERLTNIILENQIKFLYISYQKFNAQCYSLLSRSISSLNLAKILFIGPKSFGNNLNFLSLVPEEDWSLQKVEVSKDALYYDNILRKKIENDKYISILELIASDGVHAKVADADGSLITIDGEHLTKPGALFIACLFDKLNYGKIIHPDFKSATRNCN